MYTSFMYLLTSLTDCSFAGSINFFPPKPHVCHFQLNQNKILENDRSKIVAQWTESTNF